MFLGLWGYQPDQADALWLQEAALAARREAGELGALRQQLGELQSGGAGAKVRSGLGLFERAGSMTPLAAALGSISRPAKWKR